jgi:hypothetical protein
VAGIAFFVPLLATSILVIGLALLVFYLGKRLKLALTARTANRYTSPITHPKRRIIFRIYQQALKLLARKKYRRRKQWETLAEYANRAGNLPALTRLTQAAEIAAYRPEAPDAETIATAEDALAALKDELSKGRPPIVDG